MEIRYSFDPMNGYIAYLNFYPAIELIIFSKLLARLYLTNHRLCSSKGTVLDENGLNLYGLEMELCTKRNRQW